uniref:USP domain-containing protein n=1 Tax=Strigamia maritima TaxID=126957 RepID=T1JFF1_STRMM
MSTHVNPPVNTTKRLKLSLKTRRLNHGIGENDVNHVKNEEFNKKLIDHSNSSAPGFAGLANLGNTCFMNTVINVLRYSPGFAAYLHNLCQLIAIVKHSTNDFIPLCWELVSQLHKVFSSLSDVEKRTLKKEKDYVGDKMIIYPQELLSILRQLNPLFDGNYQHDAHELLCCLLNYVREAEHGVMAELKGPKNKSRCKRTNKSRNQPPITGFFNAPKKKTDVPDSVTTTFESRMAFLTRCNECENSSEMKEVFLNVTVSPHSHEKDSSDEEDSSDEKTDWTWFREAMLKTETLNGDNKYWCEACLQYNEATRSHKFLTLPPILIIQLKRFTSSFNSIHGFSKVADFIPTPPKLECLLDQCQMPCSNCTHSYRLYAVISHSGLSLTSGHYTSLVKRSKWPENNHYYLRQQLSEAQKDLEEQAKSAIKTRQKVKEENSPCYLKSYAKDARHEDCCDLVVEEANWLQYDDEKVNCVTEDELKKLLAAPKNTSWTPYLLFYTNNLHNS